MINITSYDITTRVIKVRISIPTGNTNNVVISDNGTSALTSPKEISLKLNVPILVNLNEGTKNNFIRKDHISGNT